MNADLAEALTRYIQRELIADRAALRGIAVSDSDSAQISGDIMRITSRPRTSFYIRGPEVGPVHTIFHLGSIGTGSRKTPSGPRFHARLESQSGQIYRCEHNHRTESAAVKCANSKATRQAALAEFARLDQQAAAQAAVTQAKADRKAARKARGHFWNG